jgi:predicted RND superfamily exporter protein
MLFSFVARGIRNLQQWPRLVITLDLAICLLLLWPIANMHWKLSLADLLSPNIPSRQVAEQVEQKFGGLGTLTLVIQSPDSITNSKIITNLSSSLSKSPLVNFCEFRTEADFYRKHQFLYIKQTDLAAIRDRIRDRLNVIKAARNPLVVTLDSTLTPDTTNQSLSLEDLEQKYLSSLRPFLGNSDGTIRVLEIYPNKPLGDLSSNRALVSLAKNQLAAHPLSLRVQAHFAGAVFESASTGGMLLKELYRIAWISGGLILLFLVLWFFRQPIVPLVAAVPLGMSLIWTLGFNALYFDSMNFFTLILSLIIPGLAANHLTHFLSHYADERRRGLGPDLALESTVLGTGPVITVVSIASAIAFFSLLFLPLQGLRQLGIVGGMGVLFNWATIMLFLPTLLTVLQRRKVFQVYGPRRVGMSQGIPTPFQDWKRLLPILILGSLLLASQGVFPQFEYDFSKLEYQKPSRQAKALLEKSGIPAQEPAVVFTKGAEQSRMLVRQLQTNARTDSTRTIQRVVSFSSLLPVDQEAKLSLLSEIRQLLSPEVLSSLKGVDSVNAERIRSNWDVDPLTEDDLPLSYRRKFIGRDSSVGEFSFIFPSIDTDHGSECRRFARDVRDIHLPDSSVAHATSHAIIRADILDQSLPWMSRSLIFVVAGIFLLVLIHQNRLYRTLIVLAPPAVGFLWFLSILRLLGIPINPYSAQVFPLLIGISISGSLHLWHQYRERSTGSVGLILRQTGPIVSVASITVIVCFSGLLFSSHPGLRSMGLVAVIGMLSLLLAHLTIFPLLVGFLDWLRFKRNPTL